MADFSFGLVIRAPPSRMRLTPKEPKRDRIVPQPGTELDPSELERHDNAHFEEWAPNA